MNAYQAEEQDNIRVRKAADFLAYCRNAENEARKALAASIEQTKRAKEKYEALFIECDKRAGERRKAGLIPNNAGY